MSRACESGCGEEGCEDGYGAHDETFLLENCTSKIAPLVNHPKITFECWVRDEKLEVASESVLTFGLILNLGILHSAAQLE